MLTNDDKVFLIETAKETYEEIDSKVTPLIDSISTLKTEDFISFNDIFGNLTVIFEEFGFKTLARHTKYLEKLSHYCSNFDSSKGHQKSLLIIKDFSNTIKSFPMIFSDKNAMMSMRRDCEVQRTKVERLFMGEFYSLHKGPQSKENPAKSVSQFPLKTSLNFKIKPYNEGIIHFC